MGLALLLILVALILASVGLFLSTLKWVLVLAALLFVAGLLTGWARRHAAA
jgi:hypothetical protein